MKDNTQAGVTLGPCKCSTLINTAASEATTEKTANCIAMPY